MFLRKDLLPYFPWPYLSSWNKLIHLHCKASNVRSSCSLVRLIQQLHLL
jgi:pentatricopeptide repeat protein